MRVLANSIQNVQIAQVTHDIVADRWDNWDLTDYMVYLVDTVAASALPYLAEQFDMNGLRGFAVADTEEQQRELIKASIRLHKFIGTPYAIRQTCETIGYKVVILTEGVPSNPPQPLSDWARFKIYVSTNENRPVTIENMNKIRDFINIYKPERSHLINFGYYHGLSENLPINKWSENLDIKINGEIKWAHVLTDSQYTFPFDSEGKALAVKIEQ